jgi:thiamine pyrophosphokinase
MSSSGLRWQAYSFEMPWQGTLNEATGDVFTLQADGDYLVYRTF